MQGKDRALVAVGGVLGIAALWYAAPRLYDFLKAKAEAEVKKWVKNALLDLTGSVLPTTAEAAKVTKQLPPAVLEKPKPKADRGTTHCKPGRPLTYADSEAYAAKMGGRLLTLEEAKALMGGKPLYPKRPSRTPVPPNVAQRGAEHSGRLCTPSGIILLVRSMAIICAARVP